jgi:hypothetical protein
MSIAAAVDVAKKKPSKPEPPAEDKGRNPIIVQVRGSEEYKDWATRLAKFDDRPLSSLVERALRLYSRGIGFNEEPPER